MIKRAVLLLVGFVGITAVDEPQPKYTDLTDQKALVLIKPGETKEVMLCWHNVPGGRAPAMALSDQAEATWQEVQRLNNIEKLESNGVTMTLDWKRSSEIATQLIEHDQKYWVVAAVKVTAGPKAKPGPMDIYVHYAAGTGRGVYRRGSICVLVGKEK